MSDKRNVWFESVKPDHVGMKITFEIHDDDAEKDDDVLTTHIVPAIFKVCDRCAGRGTHDHPAFSNGITSSEWEHDWDDESRESYMRGAYDVRCEQCNGERVELVIDETRATEDFIKLYYAILESTHADRLEAEHERKMGY